MTSIDPLLDRKFDRNHYQCAHFVTEAWKYLVGGDLQPALCGLLRPVKDKVVDPTQIRNHMERLRKPVSPCVVFFFKHGISPHVGLYWKKRVLHLTEAGVRYHDIDIAGIGFTGKMFYKCK